MMHDWALLSCCIELTNAIIVSLFRRSVNQKSPRVLLNVTTPPILFIVIKGLEFMLRLPLYIDYLALSN